MDTHEEYERQDPTQGEAKRGSAENMQARTSAGHSQPSPENSESGEDSRIVTRETKNTQIHEITNDNSKQHFPQILPRFDWYAATIQKEVEPQTVLRWAQLFGDPTPFKSFNGYDTCFDFGQLKILYGGSNAPHGVHVIIHGGDACQAAVESFREAFPDHFPTRIDVCIDFQGEKAFQKLYSLLLKTKRKFGLISDQKGDWIDKKRGRTFELGGKKSVYRVKLYEKGHEQRQKNVNPNAPLDWNRVEFTIKPTSESKVAASKLSPEEVARSGRWTEFLSDLLGAVPVPRVKLDTRNKKPRSVESCESMYRQYSNRITSSVKEGYLSREHHHAALDQILDGKEFTLFPEEIYREFYF